MRYKCFTGTIQAVHFIGHIVPRVPHLVPHQNTPKYTICSGTFVYLWQNKNPCKWLKIAICKGFLFGVRERIRTPDTLVRSQVLYPAELHTRITNICFMSRYRLHHNQYAADRDRTGTMSPPRDFKSRASASSATAASKRPERGSNPRPPP